MTASPLNIRKIVNAFVPSATPASAVPAVALSAIDRFKRKRGGLWVGGTVSVSQAGLSFSPNGLNRAVHEELEPINVAANNIRAVRYQFGWITGIVVGRARRRRASMPPFHRTRNRTAADARNARDHGAATPAAVAVA
jgi:hypothetical protein